MKLAQPSLFDRKVSIDTTTRRVTNEAIRRADRHAYPAWKDAAFQVVQHLAASGQPFTTDDVWEGLHGSDRPHEPRALGGVMVRAARRGIIAKADGVRPSQRIEAHRNPKQLWKGARP